MSYKYLLIIASTMASMNISAMSPERHQQAQQGIERERQNVLDMRKQEQNYERRMFKLAQTKLEIEKQLADAPKQYEAQSDPELYQAFESYTTKLAHMLRRIEDEIQKQNNPEDARRTVSNYKHELMLQQEHKKRLEEMLKYVPEETKTAEEGWLDPVIDRVTAWWNRPTEG